jgi:hypothetical protein
MSAKYQAIPLINIILKHDCAHSFFNEFGVQNIYQKCIDNNHLNV